LIRREAELLYLVTISRVREQEPQPLGILFGLCHALGDVRGFVFGLDHGKRLAVLSEPQHVVGFLGRGAAVMLPKNLNPPCGDRKLS
jgi:hypothetical protein